MRSLKGVSFLAISAILLMLASACKSTNLTSGSRLKSGIPAESLVVEGTITVRGNEPFTAVILQTSNRNHYILKMSPEMRQRLITPTYRRVTGRLYLSQWNGRDFAHLEVRHIEIVER